MATKSVSDRFHLENWCFPRPDGSRPTVDEYRARIARIESCGRTESFDTFRKHMDAWFREKTGR